MPLRNQSRLSLAFLVLALAVFAYGCSGKRPPALATSAPGEEGSPTAGRTAPAPVEPIEEGPDVRPIEGEGASGSDIPGGALAGEGGPLADIRFELDSAALTDEARTILEKHALWLQGQRELRVIVEGHCDERGTVEYNLALGEQRARAVRDYLASLGVAAARLKVVSYGKERPLDPGSDEAAMARNRRAHFNVR
ncbi:MAG TPA: peptidoglycan-associated lipoprotein Pal [Vicinamibacteria bacterium]|nr:peptidoglycan-associated lipoprotein Pal [Vicinamibacteria bacterium]